MIQFAFEVVKLNRVQAQHLPQNPASGRVMQKAGMVCEGTLRQFIIHHDEYKDAVCYAILKQDYDALKS